MKIIKRFFKNRNFTIGFIIFSIIILAAIFADVIAPYTFQEIDMANSLQPPSRAHLFGTDNLGRDVFSRVIYGSRIALRTAFLITIIQMCIGSVIGMTAGYFGGIWDTITNIIINILLSIPGIIIAIGIISVIGPSLNNVVISLALVRWTGLARVIRAKTQSFKNYPFVESGRAIRESHFSLIFRYLLPNIVPTIIVMMTLAVPYALLSSSALSFLQLGAQPPSPDWGAILMNGKSYMMMAPWIAIFPGLILMLTAYGLSMMGEGFRVVIDPKIENK
jgi:peptide/nickel transport system permease protein